MISSQITFSSIVAGTSSLQTLASRLVSTHNMKILTISSFSRVLQAQADLEIEILFLWIRSISLSPTVGRLTHGENPVVSWPIPPLEPRTTSPQKFLAGRAIHLAATGGRWEQSCSSVLSAGLLSVLMIHMILIKRLWTGPTLSTFLGIFR